MFIDALEHWKLMEDPFSVLSWIKSSEEKRYNLFNDLRKDFARIGNLSREYLLLPFTYLPIENDDSPRFSHFNNYME